MRLFLYGTLMDPGTLSHRAGVPGLAARAVHAELPGFARVAMHGLRYPTLRCRREQTVSGILLTVPASALRRLNAYEGSAYRLRRVTVSAGPRATRAWVWIAPRATTRPWP